MATLTNIKVDRRRRAVAASYRKQGYRVTKPSAPDTLPPCHPDLIAEKDGDQVVIEIKPSDALKGANDLIELADRVAAQSGWRLELVTVRAEPEHAYVLAPDRLDLMLRPGALGDDMAYECVYKAGLLAVLLRGIASANSIRVRDKTTLHLARELVYRGVFDQDLLDRIEVAVDWQGTLLRRLPTSRSPAEQTAELEALCRDILAQTQISED